jgi:hypothetical protein
MIEAGQNDPRSYTENIVGLGQCTETPSFWFSDTARFALCVYFGRFITSGLIAAVGERASYRFFEFFTANIRNPHTRRAYARARSNSSTGFRRAA